MKGRSAASSKRPLQYYVPLRGEQNTPDLAQRRRDCAATLRKVSVPMSATIARQRRVLITAIAGLLAATFDLAFAFIFYGMHGATPAAILTFIASGLLGPAAKTMGAWSVVLGALLHYSISLCAAFTYLLASRHFRVLIRHPLACGAGFGVAMYIFMNFVVIPLSRIPFHLPPTRSVIGELCSHVFLFGMVIGASVARGESDFMPASAASRGTPSGPGRE